MSTTIKTRPLTAEAFAPELFSASRSTVPDSVIGVTGKNSTLSKVGRMTGLSEVRR